MDTQTFLNNFGAIAQAPSGVEQLRKLVLALAVSGKIVEQRPADGSAKSLLAGLPGNRQMMIDEGVIKKPRHPVGEPVDVAPHLIPESWSWVRLGDIGAIVGGGTPKSNEPRYWSDGEGVAWLTPADMRDQPDRLVTRGSRDITSDGLAESSAQLLPAGAVLFSSRAPIGHVAIAAAPLATNQGFKSCVPYESSMAEYIFTFLRHIGPEVDAQATGTTFNEVSGKEVALIPVPVPPLAEQHRIVAKVDELMALCDDLEACVAAREALAERLAGSMTSSLLDGEVPE